MSKIVALVLLVACCDQTLEGESSMSLDPRRGKLGWSDEVTEGNVGPGRPFQPGEEKKVLKVPGTDKTSQWYTVYIATKPIKMPAIGGGFQFAPGGPVIGRLHMGTDGGDVDVEFDVQSATPLAFDPTLSQGSSVNSQAGPTYTRNGLTVVSFHASNFELILRNDAANRTILPIAAAVPPPGGDFQQNGFSEAAPTVPVSAWCAYGARKTPLYRRLILSNGPSSEFPVTDLAVLPIPTAAKRFRVFRVTTIGGAVNPMHYDVFTVNNAIAVVQGVIPANDISAIELPYGAIGLNLNNLGPATIDLCSVEFELEI